MVKAELSHNPYLLETVVSFNGRPPKVNSQIEKFENAPLVEWSKFVPSIFYGEMNGYDFDLDFSGTRADFDHVRQSFADAGVGEDQVRLFFKNELGDCLGKHADLAALLRWLSENRNHRFDYEAFKERAFDVFDEAVPLLVIRGNVSDSVPDYVSLELLESALELENTELANTPLVFFVSEETRLQIRDEVPRLLKRRDVYPRQLFFVIHPSMDVCRAVRTLTDLGVDNPQVVSACNDERVLSYLVDHSVAEDVRLGVKVLDEVALSLRGELASANAENETVNCEVHARISRLEEEIASLKRLDDYFVRLDNYETPEGFSAEIEELNSRLLSWRDRKTKVSGEEAAVKLAEEYAWYCRKSLQEFSERIGVLYERAENRIWCDFEDRYEEAGVDVGYRPFEFKVLEYDVARPPELVSAFMSHRHEYYIDPKDDIFRMILNHGSSDLVQVLDFHLDEWRNEALRLLDAIAEEHNEYWTNALRKYREEQVSAYRSHIEWLTNQRVDEKASAASQLSADEKVLQEDNDWFSAFEEKLERIKRD